MTEHGTPTRYVAGCRCDDCTHAAATYQARRERRMTRAGGPLLLAARPWAAALRSLDQAGISYPTIADRAGLTANSVRRLAIGNTRQVQRRTTIKLMAAARDLINEQRQTLEHQLRLLDDAADHLDAARNAPDTTRWSTTTFLDWCDRRGINLSGLLAERDRRYLYRYPTVDTERADRIALTLGVMPHEIWPDWHNQQETA